jgi:hypothetical protein
MCNVKRALDALCRVAYAKAKELQNGQPAYYITRNDAIAFVQGFISSGQQLGGCIVALTPTGDPMLYKDGLVYTPEQYVRKIEKDIEDAWWLCHYGPAYLF